MDDWFDLDRTNFDSKGYLIKVVNECDITRLIEKENNLDNEINVLQGELRSLLHDNYSKFLSATDTIGKLKENLSEVEVEKQHLSTKLQSLNECSSKIMDTTMDRYQSICRLSGRHKAIQMFRPILDFNAKLEIQIRGKQYEMAIETYMAGRGFLEKYGHVPAFRNIRQESEELIGVLKESLRSELFEDSVTTYEMRRNKRMLLRLREPLGVICTDYLSEVENKLIEYMSDIDVTVEQMLSDFAEQCLSVLYMLSHYADIYREVFLVCDVGTSKEIEGASRLLESFINKMGNPFFDRMRQRLCADGNARDHDQIVDALEAIDSIHAKASRIETLEISSKIVELVAEMCETKCKQLLAEVRSAFVKRFVAIEIQLIEGNYVIMEDGRVFEIQDALMNCFGSFGLTVGEIKPFLRKDLTFTNTAGYDRIIFHGCFVKCLLNPIFDGISRLASTATEADGKALSGAETSLLLSRLFFALKERSTIRMFGFQAEWFVTLNDDDFASVDSEFREKFQTYARHLLEFYVSRKTEDLLKMLRIGLDARDWMCCMEPRSVRSVARRIADTLLTINGMATVLYGDEYSDDSEGTTTTEARISRYDTFTFLDSDASSNSIPGNIRNLFSGPVDLNEQLHFNRRSIIVKLCRLCVKGFVELVRTKTFSRFGLQQMQVDLQFLRDRIAPAVDDECVEVLFDEVLSSCFYRCTDPIPMEDVIVDLICRTARGFDE